MNKLNKELLKEITPAVYA